MEVTFLQSTSLLLAREILGILFLMQGIDKVFNIGITNVTATASTILTDKFPGRSFFRALIFLSSWVEIIGGAMLVFGLERDYALLLLGADLLVTGVLFSLIKPMWDMQYYFPRLILLLVLMIAPAAWDTLRIDTLLR